MALKTAAVIAMAALSLTACGKVMEKVVPGYATKDEGAAQVNIDSVPRSELAKAGQPVMRVNVPARGLDTLLVVRDTTGNVTSWRTGDGTVFSLRDGLLIETRGLGADLMSSAVPAKGQVAAGGGRHSRSYYFIGSEDQVQRRDYSCVTEDRGAETLTIQGAAFETRHMAEVCQRGEGFRITNQFWFDGDVIRRSLQWAGPELGMVEFRRIID